MNSHDSASFEADFFTFDYELIDDPDEGQRFTRYWDLEPLMRGPQPVPDWLVTDRAAIETELGILKTGKEADVFLLERAVSGQDGCVLAAKRYRDADHRLFHRDVGYLEGRRTRKTRETRAMATRTDFGRQVIAQQWAATEFDTLGRLWSTGIAVPYPVQLADRELLLEFIGTADGTPAPRLAEAVLADDELGALWEQCVDAVLALGAAGYTHGDLSPYNILVHGGRVVLIDLPQVVDLVVNPQGLEFLERDCRNLCTWFARRRVATVEPERLVAWVLDARP